MSDFAGLLSQLDQSAKRAATTSKGSENEDLRKRKREEQDEPTPDIRELKIRLAFLVIGAQKAGTTWLYQMLRKIPELGLPDQKELHFWDWHRRKGLGWYSRQFPKGKNLGEITPCYMTLPDRDIREIRKLFPNVRIIFLARDLVERAWSALTMELRNSVLGLEPGQFAAEEDTLDPQTRNRIQRESDPERQPDSYFMDRLKHSTHTSRSDYAAGLRRWLQHFPNEQLLILNYKDVGDNPQDLLTQVLTHITVNNAQDMVNRLSTDELKSKFNVGMGASKPIRPSLRKKMEIYLRPYAKAFNELLQEMGYTWTLNEYD